MSNKEFKDCKRLLRVQQQLMINVWNLGLKESVEVKYKDDICTELCLKPWFESDWYFCNNTDSGWF